VNPWLPIVFCTVCVCGTVWAETRERRALSWLFKPLAAACFIWLAWLAGALNSNYGNCLLLGLACCWLGDVLLIPDSKRSFLAGLGSFLLGHLFYAVAFLQLPASTGAILLASPAVVALAYFSLRWLRPHVPADMKLAVSAYIAVISAMLLCAAAVWQGPAGAWIVVGAWGFAISDLAVARQQFVQHAALNRVWGLPLYFGSQMILAWTPALI
jgi:uncharacterized membrane protein YhhN